MPPADPTAESRLNRLAGRADGGWVPGEALRTAAARYSWQHPPPTADPAEDVAPRGGVRRLADVRRVRWAVSWRAAGGAAFVVALVAGAVALRAVALSPGAAVDLPEPAPPGSGVTVPTGPEAGGTSSDAGAPGAAPGPPDGGGADAVGSSGGAELVVVHVVGAVAAPGVVRLPAGSRVEDAVAAAGGAAPEADLAGINLARVLVDGEQVVVPRPGEPAAPAAAGGAAASTGPVSLNSASLAELDALPGVGPVLAQRIVDGRPYTAVDQLDEVSGIGPTLLERLRPLVQV